ncbi:MAG TPA: twin-arginine translocase TatA/TatE family subunit [Terriglobales bacterium]
MTFLLVLALVVFGPKRLPEITRKIGKIYGEFRRASQEFQSQIQEEVRRLEIDEATNSIGSSFRELKSTVGRDQLGFGSSSSSSRYNGHVDDSFAAAAPAPVPSASEHEAVPTYHDDQMRDSSFDGAFDEANASGQSDQLKGQHA